MFLAQIQFPLDATDENSEAQDTALSILAAMFHNGQIASSEYLLLESPQGFSSFVNILAEDALEEKHHNIWVQKSIEDFIRVGGKAPTFALIGQDAESNGPCECDEFAGLILFTTFISLESPLRCAHCFRSVPLYRIPPTYQGEYWNVRGWEGDYKACDTLQMHCTVLELSMLRQMSQLGSALTKSGLKICRTIASLTEQPAYYYLHIYNGVDVASEDARKCPKCGGDWLVEERWHGKFDFKCDKCHLLSNIALNYLDE